MFDPQNRKKNGMFEAGLGYMLFLKKEVRVERRKEGGNEKGERETERFAYIR